jgi:hypothetical protein
MQQGDGAPKVVLDLHTFETARSAAAGNLHGTQLICITVTSVLFTSQWPLPTCGARWSANMILFDARGGESPRDKITSTLTA